MVQGLEALAVSFNFFGKILIIIMALLIHKAMQKQGKINIYVIKELKLEQFIGALSILLLTAAYVIEIWFL